MHFRCGNFSVYVANVGWLGLYRILCTQVVAISCLKQFKISVAIVELLLM